MTAPRRPVPGAGAHDPMLEMVLGAAAHAERAARSVRALADSGQPGLEEAGRPPDALVDMALGVVALADALGRRVRAWGEAGSPVDGVHDRERSSGSPPAAVDEAPQPAELLR